MNEQDMNEQVREYIAKCSEVVGISGKTFIVPDYIDTSKEIVRCRDCDFYNHWDASGPYKEKMYVGILNISK